MMSTFSTAANRLRRWTLLPNVMVILCIIIATVMVRAGVSSRELRHSSSPASTAASSSSSSAGASDDFLLFHNRLLFWSRYDFNIDAATHQLGPLDVLLRCGAGAAESWPLLRTAQICGHSQLSHAMERNHNDDGNESNNSNNNNNNQSNSHDNAHEDAHYYHHHHHHQDDDSTDGIGTRTSQSWSSSRNYTAVNGDTSRTDRVLTTTRGGGGGGGAGISSDESQSGRRHTKKRVTTSHRMPSLQYTLFQKGDGSQSDPEGIPTRYLNMHNGNREAARRSLEATLQWRTEHDIDNLLNTAQTKFDLCKSVFPHYFLGRTKGTNHVVFVQHPARLDLNRARLNGLESEELLMHYVFVNEYLWQVVEKDDALATMVSIIDLQGLHLGILRQTDILAFVQKFVSTMDSFYPQRAHKTLLLNAPKWFNAIYKLLSPLMRDTTKAKIEIYSRGKKQDEALKRYIDENAIRASPASFWSSWKPPKKNQKKEEQR